MTDLEKAKQYFGRNPDSRGATALMKSNPDEYHRIKEIAIAEGLRARSEHLNPNVRDRWNPKQFTESELQILGQVSEVETKKYYCNPSAGDSDTLTRLATEQPERYKLVRQSAVLRGLVPATQTPTAPTPKPTSSFFRLSDELADRAGLPHGYQCNADGLATVLKVIEDRKEQKIAAEALAAKTLAQQARDKAADDSAEEFGRLLEINRALAAKQAA